ncbi:hypothetical protein [Desulfitobacterium dichloroeliminans]|nr:hypothetical protein [Desulfitobacterium dichloroeliminans]
MFSVKEIKSERSDGTDISVQIAVVSGPMGAWESVYLRLNLMEH